MSFRTSLIIFLALLNNTGFSQCEETKKVTYGGDWNFIPYIHLCPTYNFAFGGDTSKEWSVLTDPIDILQAPKEVILLKQKVDDSIRAYAGDAFYDKIVFNSVEVVYPELLQLFRDKGRQDVSLKYCKAKYFFYYEFKPVALATYHIGIAVDEKGEVLSKFNFPARSDYKGVNTDFSYCRLISIARKTQPKIDPIKSISLELNKEAKRFYWLIVQELTTTKDGKNYYNTVLIDAADLTKVTKSRDSFYVISCNGCKAPPFPKFRR